MDGTKFLILFSGRCGGTLLQRSLNNHPNVLCEGELLQHKSFPEQVGMLDWVYSHINQEIRAAGLKTKLMETRSRDYPRLTAYLKEQDVKLVHLYRDNPVKHALSHLTVEQLVERTNHWEAYRDEDRARPIHVDPKKIRATLFYIEEFERRTHCFALQFKDALHISYERLAEDIPGVLKEVQEYLGLPVRDDIVEPMKKVTSDDLGQAIENYSEFCVAVWRMIRLRGTRDNGFYPYLDRKSEIIEHLIQADPADAGLKIEAGWLFLDEGDLERARTLVEEARQLDPSQVELAEIEAAIGASSTAAMDDAD